MFWVDRVAQELKQRNLPLEWVDDMKTPSGKIHVGALMGVVIHDLVYRALQDAGVKAEYTYVFDNHDPMDGLPVYLQKEKYEQYMGSPLFKIPSPVKGYASYAEYYAKDFMETFNTIGSFPKIIWATDLYKSGKMNGSIKLILDKAEEVRRIYENMYKKPLPPEWYPFNVYCEKCGKVSTTRVYNWDGEHVSYRCVVDAVDYAVGCGYTGKTSPFSTEQEIKGKLPWKVEWAVKWKVIGVTVEGAGKDHMSKGGSHDLASQVAQKILHYDVPYAIAYEWLLIGGRKMSTSKGVGTLASDMLEFLPPELVRFLIVKLNIREQTNFDPIGQTIPRLFDEYQEYAEHYFSNQKDDYARIFELSQIRKVKKPPAVRFSTLAHWVQMPNMEEKIKEEGAEDWAKYARVWVEKYALEQDRFLVQHDLPKEVKSITPEQKKYLQKVLQELEKDWRPEELQTQLYEWSKELGISPKDAFTAIYISLIGKPSGPKAGFLLVSLDKNFLKKRFQEVSA